MHKKTIFFGICILFFSVHAGRIGWHNKVDRYAGLRYVTANNPVTKEMLEKLPRVPHSENAVRDRCALTEAALKAVCAQRDFLLSELKKKHRSDSSLTSILESQITTLKAELFYATKKIEKLELHIRKMEDFAAASKVLIKEFGDRAFFAESAHKVDQKTAQGTFSVLAHVVGQLFKDDISKVIDLERVLDTTLKNDEQVKADYETVRDVVQKKIEALHKIEQDHKTDNARIASLVYDMRWQDEIMDTLRNEIAVLKVQKKEHERKVIERLLNGKS